MKKVALIVIVLVNVMTVVYGSGSNGGNDPSELELTKRELMSLEIRGDLPSGVPSPSLPSDSVSQVFQTASTRYVIQNLHQLVPELRGSEYEREYILYNKGLQTGQILFFYPVSQHELATFIGLLDSGVRTSPDPSDFTVGASVNSGKIILSQGSNPAAARFYDLLKELTGRDYSKSMEGALIGTVYFNLDIYETEDVTPDDSTEFVEGKSFLDPRKRVMNEGRFNRFGEEVQVDFRLDEHRALSDRNVELVNSMNRGQSDRSGNPLQFPELNEPFFLEPWSTINSANPYINRILNPASGDPDFSVYVTEHGLWFPVAVLETMGEIQERGDYIYRILKWPADDRSHCGG